MMSVAPVTELTQLGDSLMGNAGLTHDLSRDTVISFIEYSQTIVANVTLQISAPWAQPIYSQCAYLFANHATFQLAIQPMKSLGTIDAQNSNRN